MVDTVDAKEEQPAYRYESIVSPDSVAKVTEGNELTHFAYPEQRIGGLGMAHMLITQGPGLEEEYGPLFMPVLIGDGAGIRKAELGDALKLGYAHSMAVVEQPMGKHRKQTFGGGISVDGQHDAATFPATVNDALDYHAQTGNYWSFGSFYLPNDDKTGKGRDLFVPNDPKILSGLKFRFQVVQGGDV